MNFNRVFHYKPSILGVPLFLETPSSTWRKGQEVSANISGISPYDLKMRTLEAIRNNSRNETPGWIWIWWNLVGIPKRTTETFRNWAAIPKMHPKSFGNLATDQMSRGKCCNRLPENTSWHHKFLHVFVLRRLLKQYVLGSKLPLFPYNRGWSSTQ